MENDKTATNFEEMLENGEEEIKRILNEIKSLTFDDMVDNDKLFKLADEMKETLFYYGMIVVLNNQYDIKLKGCD